VVFYLAGIVSGGFRGGDEVHEFDDVDRAAGGVESALVAE